MNQKPRLMSPIAQERPDDMTVMKNEIGQLRHNITRTADSLAKLQVNVERVEAAQAKFNEAFAALAAALGGY